MCAFGMTSTDEQGEGLVCKPTTFMTNSSKLANHLSKHCDNQHRHVILINGRAKQAVVYPDALCDTICKGIREQIDHDQFLTRLPQRLVASVSLPKPININSVVNDEPDAPAYYVDVIDAKLKFVLVKQATASDKGSFLNELASNQQNAPQFQVNYLFEAAFARKPSKQELEIANKLIKARNKEPFEVITKEEFTAALQDVWWAVLNSNEFILNH